MLGSQRIKEIFAYQCTKTPGSSVLRAEEQVDLAQESQIPSALPVTRPLGEALSTPSPWLESWLPGEPGGGFACIKVRGMRAQGSLGNVLPAENQFTWCEMGGLSQHPICCLSGDLGSVPDGGELGGREFAFMQHERNPRNLFSHFTEPEAHF